MRYLILALCLWCSTAYSAELLVLNQSCSDPSCMKAGDIASIHPDGTKWEEVCKKCVPPLWRIVKFPGILEKDLQYLLEPLTEEKTEVIEGKEIKQSETIRERKYKLPSILTSASYDAKGMYSVPTKSVSTIKDSFVAKSLLTEKTAIVAEKEALSVEISR